MSDPDPHDDSLQGTGDVIGQIGDLTIRDDGDGDTFVVFDHPKIDSTGNLRTVRGRLGDTAFKALFEQAGGDASVSAASFESPEPVAFSCRGCHETYPRTQNDGTDHCPDCSGGR